MLLPNIPFVKACLISTLIAMNLLSMHAIQAQTTWTGASSTDWTAAINWSAGIPDVNDIVTIPDVTNNPVISTTDAVAKSVVVQVGGELTINAGGTLTINGSTDQGFLNSGTVSNSGIIEIGNVSGVGLVGFRNLGALTNHAGGQININRVNAGGQSIGLENETSIPLSNSGIIRIGNVMQAGLYAISNDAPGVFNNNATGELHLDRAVHVGIRNSATFNNSGLIKIGAVEGGNTIGDGISSSPTSQYFTNLAGGQIHIDRCTDGFEAANFSSSTNAGTMTVGAIAAVPNLVNGNQTGTLKNVAAGVIKTTSTIKSDYFVQQGGTLSPGYSPGKMTFDKAENFSNGICAIEVNGIGTPGIHFDQIEVNGEATLGGTLALTFNYTGTTGDQVEIFLAHSFTGSFTTVTGLPADWIINYLPTRIILSKGLLAGNYWTGSVSTNWNDAGNWAGGIPDATDDIVIPDVINNPVLSTNNGLAKSITVQAGGSITVSSTGVLTINGSVNYGIWNQGSFENNGTIHIGNISSAGGYAINNQNSFINNTTGIINIDRVGFAGIYAISGTFNNNGTVVTGALVPVTNLITASGTGTFSNDATGNFKGSGNLASARFINAGGQLSPGYSPGTLTFNPAENFANSVINIEVNGITSPGVNYDRINVTGTATLGGTLALTINYAANTGDQITILSATSISGTFSNITGLLPNWQIHYESNAVILSYGFNFWTGNTSTIWETAGNWSLGLLPTTNHIVIIQDVANDPVVSSNNALAKSVSVLAGGIITINASGTLTINGATSQGLLNQGTVNNSGTIQIGNTNLVGLYGLINQGSFTNNAGATITINRVTGAQCVGLDYRSGTFVNSGTIQIGNITQGGQYGLDYDAGTFSNTGTGAIFIDNVLSVGIRGGANATFNNSGSISIGSLAGGSNMNNGISVVSAFNNNTGGTINIDRINGTAFDCANFSQSTNAGTITIGSLVPVTMLFGGNQTGKISNNAGGMIKGTGTIPSSRLDNNGGTLSPGYSPGKMTFDASENFVNNTMLIEINGTGTPGVQYDQVLLNTGTATIGGTLDIDINYTPSNGDQFIILSAPVVSGTFSTITGLLPSWQIIYNANSVVLKYDSRNTWTGNVSTNWTTAGNWTLGVPNTTSEITIPNVTNDPVITTPVSVKSVHIGTGSVLTVEASGSLTTLGTSLYNGVTSGIYNQGMLNAAGYVQLE